MFAPATTAASAAALDGVTAVAAPAAAPSFPPRPLAVAQKVDACNAHDSKAQGAGTRVVHVVLSMDVGGLERVVLDLVGEGRAIGQQPAVVCLERPGTLAPQAEALGAAVYCMN